MFPCSGRVRDSGACVLALILFFSYSINLQVQGLESPAGNEHLNSALMPMLPPPDLAQPVENGRKRDSLPPLPSRNSQPETKAAFNLSSAPNMKRNSSGGVFRQSTLNVAPAKKRLSSIGVASSHGRLFKVLGDFFLLAGRTEDASVWYVVRVHA